MTKTNYTLGADVFNVEGQKLGTIDRVVIDPKTDEITHLVIRKGFLFKTDKVIPTGMIQEASEDTIYLNARITDLDVLPDFEAKHYVEVTDPAVTAALESENRNAVFWYPPLMASGGLGLSPTFYSTPAPQVEIRERNIPAGTVALKKNATVISKDGDSLGKINRVYINPDTDQAEYFLVTHGQKEEKMVPAWWIDVTNDEEVHLVLNSATFNRLPNQEEQQPS